MANHQESAWAGRHNERTHTAAFTAIWIITRKPCLCGKVPYKYVGS